MDAIIPQGQLHLKFMLRNYRKQLSNGNYVVHAHPSSAVSRDEREMASLADLPTVTLTVADQGMYGLQTRTGDGGSAPAL